MKKVANTMAPITAPLSLVLAIGMRLIHGPTFDFNNSIPLYWLKLLKCPSHAMA